MHVIGTAGHVDHGKTALIKALTGIDADRLPEEKERGMTIDLGFAHFPGPDGNPIGVIDVPGHERFIRNMVAGAWSLSCGLLVVAGDEGWMAQTEDHARVLEAMAIPRIMCVITKKDLIDTELLALVTEEIKAKCEKIFPFPVPVLSVSSVTGEGIGETKEAIGKVLEDLDDRFKHEQSAGSNSGYLHIDRVFSIKGAGTVVTGSLAGGYFRSGDEITIIPSGQKTRIRGLQSYYSGIEQAEPVSRLACNVQNVKTEEVKRGDIAVQDPKMFWVEKEFLVYWEPIGTGREDSKRKKEIEIAFGTAHHICTIQVLDNRKYARVKFAGPAACRWKDRFLLIRHGGSEIIGKGMFLWPGKTDGTFRKLFSATAETVPFETVELYPLLKLLLSGWYEFSDTEDKEKIENSLKEQPRPFHFYPSGIILDKNMENELQLIKSKAAGEGGLTKAEYYQQTELPRSLAEHIFYRGINKKVITETDGVFFSSQAITDSVISASGKKILQLLKEGKYSGIELKKLDIPGAQKELRNLVRMGKAIPVEGGIFFDPLYFEEIKRKIIGELTSGSKFTIPEAKEKTELSRKYIIPVLNKLEELGYVRRDGDVRIVC